MSQIYHFNPAYLYITIRYKTALLMQFLRLNKPCKLIVFYQIKLTLLKLGLSCYDVKPHFVCSNANISYKIHFFFEKIFLVALKTYVKKMNPPPIVFWGEGAW